MMDLASTVARLVKGSVFSIPPGDYHGDVLVKVPNVHLRAQPGTVTIRGGTYGIRILDGVTGTTIEGISFVGQAKNPVYVKAGCHRTTIRDCHMSGMRGSGILTANAHEVNIQGNLVEGGDDHGIYASQSGDRGQITGNTVRNCAASAIQVNAHQPGQKAGDPAQDGLSSGWLISGNTIEGSGQKGGAAINLSGCVDTVVESNTIRGQKRGIGIALFADEGGGLPCQRVTVRSNRISVPGAGVQVTKGCKDCLVTADNIIVGSPQTDYHEKVRAA